jgi:hypothetical protein
MSYPTPATGRALVPGRAVTGRIVPGVRPPPSARIVAEDTRVGDRGGLTHLGEVVQKTRHLLPAVAGPTAAALVVSAVPIVLPLTATADRLLWLAAIALWARALIGAGVAVLGSQLYRVTFHERGFDLATGILHRRRRFVWYYQLTGEPTYLRTPLMFLTHTASLQVAYDDGGDVKSIELAGIGSPAQVEHIRQYIETRRLAERIPMRGFFT